MKSIHIRDISSETLSKLKRLAAVNHRSLQGELRHILDRAAQLAPDPVERPLKLYKVKSDVQSTWSREDIYGDSGR